MQSIQAPFFNLTFEGSFLHIEKTRVAGTLGETSFGDKRTFRQTPLKDGEGPKSLGCYAHSLSADTSAMDLPPGQATTTSDETTKGPWLNDRQNKSNLRGEAPHALDLASANSSSSISRL